MTDRHGGRARTPRPSARPHRPLSVHDWCTLADLTLALIAIVTALAIIIAPPTGPIDGRHLLAVAAVLILTARTTRATRR